MMVLPLVVRIERANPPQRTDAMEAASLAVLHLLDEPGEWADAVEEWQSGMIRKVVRRARGAEWARAEALPGCTVEHRSAEVRVYPPVGLDGWPRDLARLQVSGTTLTDEAEPAESSGVVLWENPELEMTAGKAMAQAGHAAQIAWWASSEQERAAWREQGMALSVRMATPERFAELMKSGMPVVQDAGFTEIAPGSATFVAEVPWLRG